MVNPIGKMINGVFYSEKVFQNQKVEESLNEMISFVENSHLNMEYYFTSNFTSIIYFT